MCKTKKENKEIKRRKKAWKTQNALPHVSLTHALTPNIRSERERERERESNVHRKPTRLNHHWWFLLENYNRPSWLLQSKTHVCAHMSVLSTHKGIPLKSKCVFIVLSWKETEKKRVKLYTDDNGLFCIMYICFE